MKSFHSPSINFMVIIGCLMLTALAPGKTAAQIADSLGNPSCSALQFHLIGDVGVFYLANFGPGSFLRVGVDGSWGHSDKSGEREDIYTSLPSTGSPSTDYNVQNPEDKNTSYTVDISGVYALNLVGFANSSLYAGAGPMVSYSYGSGSSTTSYVNGTLDHYREASTTSSTTKTWGLGPVAIVGVRCQIIRQVALTAEVSASAMHEWTSYTHLWYFESQYTGQNPSAGIDSENDHTTGWRASLNSIIIGVVVAL